MSFLHSAFTENSAEAREWLESIGYDMRLCDSHNEYVCAGKDGVAFTTDYGYPSFNIFTKKEGGISCVGNLPLFKAISAMRDDSDYMQYFTFNGEFELNPHHGIVEDMSPVHKSRIQTIGRKASLDELINHFKK